MALELAAACPGRVASVSLLSTHPGMEEEMKGVEAAAGEGDGERARRRRGDAALGAKIGGLETARDWEAHLRRWYAMPLWGAMEER